ncbi:MAG TPA: SRPBCC family protein [Trebonia sp.]|nr:SRPBCC family protein [Trebonia sp.]
MIELDRHFGYPFRSARVFRALADVTAYPDWQSDVLAAVLHGGPIRLGAEFSLARRVLGRSACFRFQVTAYQQGRVLALRSLDTAWPRFSHSFQLARTAGERCLLSVRTTVDGAVPVSDPVAVALFAHQMTQTFDDLRSYLATGPSAGRNSQKSPERTHFGNDRVRVFV